MREGMRGNYQPLTLADIKNLDIVDYLATVGHEPVKVRGADHWYLSPLRSEKTASFKVNRRLNRWYDHGIGKGGNLVDFAIDFFQCSVKEVLQNFSGDLSLRQPILSQPIRGYEVAAKGVQIQSVQPVSAKMLFQYLSERKISEKVAKKYCYQVHYKLGDSQYFALGFRNDLEGYELRNSFSKVSSSPKAITSVNNGAETVSVFEGFFDFLSYKTLLLQTGEELEDHVVLNSISLFERARPFMERHSRINLYLDTDAPGRQCSFKATRVNEKYKDASGLYEGFKDLNEWLVRSF
ncbi:CHC2 zinc finger domain-containing protein [Dyadobacter chenwenxiniae]|uniref:CHC2 zinc finger domain-containing protein n=1 Tax=Dyadobacter chenwenxiniae TaxID=2906456 RepID=A0A9X1PQN7_9BACT|nr:toprim domain-containing protein [Dyadobacter chenwenxiniae]MCF0065670.1 CHC2 zinc finger domain-containing protein [Dyadobacter chenwenxiniae]UON85578.1 CHC2 zinc finger domain-containing protein [Dyadobacter chenwenxiniae]